MKKFKAPMVVKGNCRVKKEPYKHHELDLRAGQEFKFEYLGSTCGAQRRVYRLTDSKGKVQYLGYNYFNIYMEYGKEKDINPTE
jgi:hypothetical protein